MGHFLPRGWSKQQRVPQEIHLSAERLEPRLVLNGMATLVVDAVPGGVFSLSEDVLSQADELTEQTAASMDGAIENVAQEVGQAASAAGNLVGQAGALVSETLPPAEPIADLAAGAVQGIGETVEQIGSQDLIGATSILPGGVLEMTGDVLDGLGDTLAEGDDLVDEVVADLIGDTGALLEGGLIGTVGDVLGNVGQTLELGEMVPPLDPDSGETPVEAVAAGIEPSPLSMFVFTAADDLADHRIERPAADDETETIDEALANDAEDSLEVDVREDPSGDVPEEASAPVNPTEAVMSAFLTPSAGPLDPRAVLTDVNAMLEGASESQIDAVIKALEAFLADLENLGPGVAAGLAHLGMTTWVATAVIAASGSAELARRKLKQRRKRRPGHRLRV